MAYAVIQTDADGMATSCILKNNRDEAIELAVKIVEENLPTNTNSRERFEKFGWFGERDWTVTVVLTD